MYPKYDSKRFSDLITGDETWVHFFEPKRKCSNRVWATKHAKRPVIAKRTATVKKVLYCIFFSIHGPAIQVSVPKGRSVTAKFYKNVVFKKLNKYFRARRPKHGIKHVSLLHDNASSHKVHIVQDYLKKKKSPSVRTSTLFARPCAL